MTILYGVALVKMKRLRFVNEGRQCEVTIDFPDLYLIRSAGKSRQYDGIIAQLLSPRTDTSDHGEYADAINAYTPRRHLCCSGSGGLYSRCSY